MKIDKESSAIKIGFGLKACTMTITVVIKFNCLIENGNFSMDYCSDLRNHSDMKLISEISSIEYMNSLNNESDEKRLM